MTKIINIQKYISKACKKAEYKKVINKHKQALMTNRTMAEKGLIEILQINNIRFEFQRIFNVETSKKPKYKIVDFYLPDYKLVVEVDGNYHQDIKQVRKDHGRTNKLIKKAGIDNVVRFTNDEIEHLDHEQIINRIMSYVINLSNKNLKLRSF